MKSNPPPSVARTADEKAEVVGDVALAELSLDQEALVLEVVLGLGDDHLERRIEGLGRSRRSVHYALRKGHDDEAG